MCRVPMMARYGAIVASVASSPPTMKKISPDTAWGCEPSIGVSMWVMPCPASARLRSTVTSGLTVEQSQVTRPRAPPAATPWAPR